MLSSLDKRKYFKICLSQNEDMRGTFTLSYCCYMKACEVENRIYRNAFTGVCVRLPLLLDISSLAMSILAAAFAAWSHSQLAADVCSQHVWSLRLLGLRQD